MYEDDKKHGQIMNEYFVRSGKIKSDNTDPRRNQERADFNMISEDPRSMANLPRKAQHHEFPKMGGYFIPMWD